MKTKIVLSLISLLSFTVSYSQCENYPILNLGNDTLLCQGQSLNLTVPAGYDHATWNIAPGNQSAVTISTPSTVILQVLNYTQNLVVNGDFEAGNTNFTTQYPYGNSSASGGILWDEGTYAITTDPNSVHENFVNCQDVTPTGTGNMMVVNGSAVPNTTVWSQSILVDPNTDYSFSAWVTSVENTNTTNVSSLQFFINNVQIGPVFSPSLNGCDWQQFAQLWNSGSNTSATISIIAQVLVGNNDFAIDDITFNTVCVQTDTLVVTYDTNTIDAGPNVSFCENEPETITATANFPNPNFVWETNQTTATITPTSNGWYTVSVVSPSGSGCVLKDSTLVAITAMPWGFDTVVAVPSDCGQANGAVYTLVHGSFVGQPFYTWSGPGANSPNFINASVWQNLSPGWYYIDLENQGCHRKDSILVTPLNPPVANLSGTPISGYGPLTVNFSNSSTNSDAYVWNLGDGNLINETTLVGQTETYDSVGTYDVMLVASYGLCTDTAWITITVLPPPVTPPVVPVGIKVPNIFTPNGDNINDFFTFELLNIKSLEVSIVNRWGNPVFQSSTIPFAWNGKDAANQTYEDGVYFYRYKALGAQDEPLEGQGFVQLKK